MLALSLPLILFSLTFFHFSGVQSTSNSNSNSNSTTLILVNKCTYSIWPATLTNAGTTPLPTSATGFSLLPGATRSLIVPTSWSGRVWARTLCSSSSYGKFSCVTGDCGTSSMQCSGSGATPPATLAEFTLSGSGLDFYDVSLVDGYNLPMVVRPVGGLGNCSTTGCMADLNGSCPSQLRVVSVASGENGQGVACRSACDAFGDPQYCCRGEYGTPDKCKPSEYSVYFKKACPDAYSYAYDDASSTFTCSKSDYVITFCPTTSAIDKSSGGGMESSDAAAPLFLIYSSNARASLFQAPHILGLVIVFLIYWLLPF